MTHKLKKALSIQVNLNGLSFCIFNRNSNTIEYINNIGFDNKQTPFQVLNFLKEELASNTVFSDEFEEIKIIHNNELSTLVPNALYDEANNADYLKYNSKILKSDFIASDQLKKIEITNVYVPYVNVNNYIFSTFGTFTYVHSSTLFIDSILKIESLEDEFNLFIDVSKSEMQIVILKNNKIIFSNYFEFSSPEDFIYYILFVVEQNSLSAEDLKLKFSGAINTEDDNYQLAYKYIRNVEILENSENFILKNSF